MTLIFSLGCIPVLVMCYKVLISFYPVNCLEIKTFQNLDPTSLEEPLLIKKNTTKYGYKIYWHLEMVSLWGILEVSSHIYFLL